MRKSQLLALLAALSTVMAGCASKHIVRAAPPSVSAPPPAETAPMPAPEAPPPAAATTEEVPAPSVPSPAVPAAPPAVRPPAPKRPAPTESAESAPAKPAPPQLSPQLSPRDLEATKTNATKSITAAEQNLQMANGRQLSPAQKDLTEKIKGFLTQSHEAIRVDDWVRAQNLAEKARVLSEELVKSF